MRVNAKGSNLYSEYSSPRSNNKFKNFSDVKPSYVGKQGYASMTKPLSKKNKPAPKVKERKGINKKNGLKGAQRFLSPREKFSNRKSNTNISIKGSTTKKTKTKNRDSNVLRNRLINSDQKPTPMRRNSQLNNQSSSVRKIESKSALRFNNNNSRSNKNIAPRFNNPTKNKLNL